MDDRPQDGSDARRGAGRLASVGGTALALVVVGMLGWVDYTTGTEFGFSLFYLLPIAVVAWWLGAGPGLVVAVGGTAAWLTAEAAAVGERLALATAWNGLTRFVFFVSGALVLSALRRSRNRLTAANEALREQADREARLARTDPVTGLLNGRSLLERVADEAMYEAKAAGKGRVVVRAVPVAGAAAARPDAGARSASETSEA